MRVVFERIGRKHEVPDLEIDTATLAAAGQVRADQIAEQVWRYAGRFLASREYMVTVDLERGTVSIDADRFGKGTIH